MSGLKDNDPEVKVWFPVEFITFSDVIVLWIENDFFNLT